MKTKKKKYEWGFKNTWKNYSAYHIHFSPSIYCVKQMTYKSIGIEWFGFTITLTKNLK